MNLFCRKFCFCVNLKLGSLVYGVVAATISISLSTFYAVFMIRNKVEPLQWYQVAYLVTSSLDFLVTIPLIYGIKKHSRYYLLPWITYNLIFLVLITVGCIVITFLTYFSAIFLLVCIVFWYFWMCIVSLFREMGMNDGRGRIINITTQPTEKTFYL